MPKETKRILEIQRTYFSLLKDCFREQYSKVTQAKGNSEAGVLDWARGKYEDEIQYNYTRRIEDIGNYWKIHDKELKNNIITLDLLPIYSVSRPMYLRKQLASAGLYCDVIVYHDESPAGLRNIGAIPPNKRTDFVINALRDYMDLLLLEPYFTIDTEVPFVIVCPGGRDFDENIEQNLIRKGERLTLDYSNDLLDTKYSSWGELKENAGTIIGSAAIKSNKKTRKPSCPF